MEILPNAIRQQLADIHMGKTWTLLQERFSFNITAWRKAFRQYYSRQPDRVTELQAFLAFGLKFIQPVLNKILGRKADYPTWYRLIEWIVKNK
jgi:hypothetical protein